MLYVRNPTGRLQAPLMLQWGHPLLRGLAFAWDARAPHLDLCSGTTMLTAAGTFVPRPHAHGLPGVGYYLTESTPIYQKTASADTQAKTLLCWWKPATFPATGRTDYGGLAIAFGGRTAANSRCFIGTNTAGECLGGSGSSYGGLSGGTITPFAILSDKLQIVTMAAAAVTGWVNGEYAGTQAWGPPAATAFAVAGRATSGDSVEFYTTGTYYLALAWNRVLSPGEVAALWNTQTRNDLFCVPQRRIYVQLPTSGTTYNDTLTLAGAAAVAQASAAIFGSSLSLAAGATAGAAGPVTATHSLSLPSAAAVSLAAAHVLAEALSLATGATAAQSHTLTATHSVSLPSAAAITPTAALTAFNSLSLPTGATFTPAATHVLAETLSLATGATFTAEAVQTLLGTLTLSASAAHQAASTLIAASTLSLAAQAGLSLSAGAITIDESLNLATAATFTLAQTAVLGAVQTYAAAAGLTGSSAGVLGNALALDVLAALSSAPTGTYHPSLALAVAAVFASSHTYTSLYTYTVLKVAAEALRQAAATTDTLTDAGVTGEDLD